MENFLSQAKKIFLSKKSKIAMRERIVDFLKENPLSVPEKFPARHVRFSFSYVFFAVVFLFFLGMFISAKANQSLPGNALYPIKTMVNEPVMETLAFSDQKKNTVHIECVKIRLKEAEALLSKGDINQKVGNQLEESFKEHSQKAILRLGEINNSAEKEKIIIEFEVLLETYEEKIDSLSLGSSKKNLKRLISAIQDTKNSLSKISAE